MPEDTAVPQDKSEPSENTTQNDTPEEAPKVDDKSKTEDTSFHLMLTGQGVNIDRPVSPEDAKAIIAIVMDISVPTRTERKLEEDVTGDETREDDAPQSLQELVDEHNAEEHKEKIVAAAFYLKRQGKTVFSSKEIIQCLEDASVGTPANPPRDIGRAITDGWIARKRGERDALYLTSKGAKAFQDQFPDEPRRRAKSSHRAGQPSKAKNVHAKPTP